MSENSQERSFFERQELHENMPDLSDSVVGIRIFKVGVFDEKSMEQFAKQVEMVKMFSIYLKNKFGDQSPQVTIITNSDLPEAGQLALTDSGLNIVQTAQSKAKRRAKLGRHIVGEKSQAKGDFSYADMLNSLNREKDQTESDSKYIFTSSDLAGKPEILSEQIVGMNAIYAKWQEERPDKLAIVGSLLTGVHNQDFVQNAIDGKKGIDLDNLNTMFPNNAMSLVPSSADFSGITDNALSGKVEAGGKLEPIGGNEDFLYGFEEMLYSGKDCVLMIEPHVSEERKGEVKGVESKYIRRQTIYRLYAKRSIEQAVKRGKIKLKDGDKLMPAQIEQIVEQTIDEHLFFSRVIDNQPEIILTERQKIKSIKAPI